MGTLVIDSFAWVEFLGAGRYGTAVKSVFEGDDRIVTPDVVLAEVARKLARDGAPEDTVRGHLGSMILLSEPQPITLDIALRTYDCDRELRARAKSSRLDGPGFVDALILATARVLNARVLTGDPHFQGLPDTVWLG